MRSAGITAAAAVRYYLLGDLSFLPALVSPFAVHSAAPLPPNTRLSERFLYGYSSYSMVCFFDYGRTLARSALLVKKKFFKFTNCKGL